MNRKALSTFNVEEKRFDLIAYISELTGKAMFYEITSTPQDKNILASIVLYEFNILADAKKQFIRLFSTSF